MPCDSTVTTKMTSLSDIETAISDFATCQRQGSVLIVTDKQTGVQLRFVQYGEGEQVEVQRTYGAVNALLNRVQQSYAQTKVKQFAKKYGYTVSKDAMSGEYVLAGYTK